MSWPWYPSPAGAKLLPPEVLAKFGKRRSWNDFADRAFNPAVGCSMANEHPWCWAKKMLRFMKPSSFECDRPGCQKCYDFTPHEHFERWDKFRANPGERIALAYLGDLFDPARSDEMINQHLLMAQGSAPKRWTNGVCEGHGVLLLQTRHVKRAVRILSGYPLSHKWNEKMVWWPDRFEIGTTFSSPADIDNVRALAQLPESVVRFVAFEPFTEWYYEKAFEKANLNWAYIGVKTPGRANHDQIEDIGIVGDWLNEMQIDVIYKASCGAALYQKNVGVTLP